MRAYDLKHVSDAVLLRDLTALVRQDQALTAKLLAHIAEVDARRLYAPAGYSSMFAYCVRELRLSEDAAYTRIYAARAAHEYPALYAAVAEGRIHLTALRLIAPFLTPENADELIAAATHRSKAEVELLLARRFPPADPPVAVRTIKIIRSEPLRKLVPEQVGAGSEGLLHAASSGETSPSGGDHPDSSAGAGTSAEANARGGDGPATTGASAELSADAAPGGDRELVTVQLTIARSTLEKLQHAQDLLGHANPTGDADHVLARALDDLIRKLESRRFAAGGKQVRARESARKRHIPAHVRRAVWKRDGGRCAFVNAKGKRCSARRFLEFDHVEPVARGGRATVEGMRLLCRTHNQLEAERLLGSEFMRHKRHEARAHGGDGSSRTGPVPSRGKRTARRLGVRLV